MTPNTMGGQPAAEPVADAPTTFCPVGHSVDSQTNTVPPPAPGRAVDSSWDGGAGSLPPHHFREWVEGSGVAPELVLANVESLQGREVLEALAGDPLERLGGHARQYATVPVAQLLRPLEPVAEAGGLWCSGLDPLAGWRPMPWGCFKPDRPRWDQERGRRRKYEHPIGVPARSFWLKVPAVVAQLVADRFGLPLPSAMSADSDGSNGTFWRWWATEPRLPLLVTEGAKKAAALLSIGIPAVALPGIWNGAPKGPDNRPALLPDLAGVPLEGRPCWVLFDHSSKANPQERKAARRLGRLLAQAGGIVQVGIVPGTHGKGADDHLVNGGSWEQLAKALKPLAAAPVLPRLRSADAVAPAGQYLGQVAPIPAPELARLVALIAAMGAGKTELIAAAVARLLAAGTRVVQISHRRSLGQALAERLGLPWGDDAAPGSDLRQQGVALCIDSLCLKSGLHINPAEWRGCVVVIDEVMAVLKHVLFATGTAVAKRRVAVLKTLAELLRHAAQVIVADAQLDDVVLQALETLTSERAYLIASEHRPAAGRRLIRHSTADGWRAELVAQLQGRNRLWISTTAREGTNGTPALAALVREHWPAARVLEVNADTIAEPNHDASRLADDPNGIAGRYDVVAHSPAVAAGLSVDRLPGHFGAVFVFAGGAADPTAVAQAAARVRDGCQRHLFAPDKAIGAHLRIGSGDTDPAALVRHLSEHHTALLGELVGGAGGWLPERNTAGAWLPLWAALAAQQNCQRLAYGATIQGLLEREGYITEDPTGPGDGGSATARLQDLALIERERLDSEVIAAAPITTERATELEQKKRRTAVERAELERHRIATTWSLGNCPPTRELLEAHREGLADRLRFGWLLRDDAITAALIAADRAAAQQQLQAGTAWAPDQCRDAIGPRLQAAALLKLPTWLERGDWFDANDPELQHLHATVTAHSSSCRQVLGISPGQRATTTLRRLLGLAGYELELKRSRQGNGTRPWLYRVKQVALPMGVNLQDLEEHWRDGLQGVDQKIPYIERGVCFGPPILARPSRVQS